MNTEHSSILHHHILFHQIPNYSWHCGSCNRNGKKRSDNRNIEPSYHCDICYYDICKGCFTREGQEKEEGELEKEKLKPYRSIKYILNQYENLPEGETKKILQTAIHLLHLGIQRGI